MFKHMIMMLHSLTSYDYDAPLTHIITSGHHLREGTEEGSKVPQGQDGPPEDHLDHLKPGEPVHFHVHAVDGQAVHLLVDGILRNETARVQAGKTRGG